VRNRKKRKSGENIASIRNQILKEGIIQEKKERNSQMKTNWMKGKAYKETTQTKTPPKQTTIKKLFMFLVRKNC
jgi:hypothetical protein